MCAPLATPLASLLLILGSAPAPPAAGGDDPLVAWYDGQAEVNGYRWRGTRYGELRTGEAVAIFVTETLGAKEHVKVDRPESHRGDTLTVLKLNLVRDFQTGLYDYDTMCSVFLDVRDLRALKQTFSSGEWCGHVFDEIDVRGRELRHVVRSYFQGESVDTALPMRPGGLVGDDLLVWLRGLRGHVLAPGEARRVPYLTDPFERRLRHLETRWGELALTRAAEVETVQVPAGSFAAVVYRLEASDGRRGLVRIEEALPHRLLSWSWERDGEVLDAGELTGSRRMKYWELHAEGQESLRKDLGLDG
ncbi:MAG TPA: hypothetical protein VF530_09210 [Planctomycetota bacterium]